MGGTHELLKGTATLLCYCRIHPSSIEITHSGVGRRKRTERFGEQISPHLTEKILELYQSLYKGGAFLPLPRGAGGCLTQYRLTQRDLPSNSSNS
jgi:hypothetical protein